MRSQCPERNTLEGLGPPAEDVLWEAVFILDLQQAVEDHLLTERENISLPASEETAARQRHTG